MKNNVSSLIPNDINNTLNSIQKPKAFGTQIINTNKSKLIYSSSNIIENYKNQINEISQKLIDLEVSHAKTQQDLLLKYSPPPPTKPTLTLEEYQKFSTNENTSYTSQKEELQKEQLIIEGRLKDIINDPYKNAKNEDLKIKNKIKRTIQSLKNNKNKEKKRLSTQVLKSGLKTLYPILALQTTKLLTQIISNNQKLQKLVDNTNNIIDSAVTQNDINNAIVVRNNTLSIIRDNERKLQSFKKTITQINRILSIFNIIIRLSNIILPIPTPPGAVPDVVTPRKERFRKKYETAVKVVEGLNVLVAIIQGIFDAQLEELAYIKSQLKNINNILDNKTSVESLSPTPIPIFPDYKGFKLVIKEETSIGNQQAVVVRGNIRRKYAAAINKDGIEVIKSEYSFTLDPQDLVEQLKLIIDQQNLQA